MAGCLSTSSVGTLAKETSHARCIFACTGRLSNSMVTQIETANQIRDSLVKHLQAETGRLQIGGVANQGHRKEFRWPPRRVSVDFGVPGSAFHEETTLKIGEHSYLVEIAESQGFVFGRVEGLWHEARGRKREEVLTSLVRIAEPLIERRRGMGECLGLPGEFTGTMDELAPLDMLKLLFARDRDIAHDAAVAIETHASLHVFGPSLIAILNEREHPFRRGAQWATLDLLEDLPSFCVCPEQQSEAIKAMSGLIWDAPDDYCRTIYKAGVVLGGHVCTHEAAEELLRCLNAPSRVGRRAAYHAAYHLVEWLPSYRDRVVQALQARIPIEPEPVLVDYLGAMSRDIREEDLDHVADPVFPDET